MDRERMIWKVCIACGETWLVDLPIERCPNCSRDVVILQCGVCWQAPWRCGCEAVSGERGDEALPVDEGKPQSGKGA